MTKKICISGYYGFDNFGDEIILQILIENLHKFKCKPLITVFSSNPQKTSDLYSVNCVNSFNLNNVINELKTCDILISGGGSLLQDVTSCRSLVYYLGIIFLAVLFRKKVVIFAQGIGPIKNRFLAFLTFCLLKKAAFITVRDEKSFNLLKNNGVAADICADPVWNLDIPKKEKKSEIGVQLRTWADLTDKVLYSLAENISKFYSHKKINIYSLQNSLDLEVCIKFNNFLHKINPDIKTEVKENISNKVIIDEISSLEAFIAMRYHACLIAIKAGVKLLPLSYDIKVEDIAGKFNLDFLEINKPEEFERKIEKFSSDVIVYAREKIKKLSYDFGLIEKIL